MITDKKKLFLLLGCACLCVVLLEEILQWKLHRFFYGGMISSKSFMNDSSISRFMIAFKENRPTDDSPVQETFDIIPTKKRLEMENSSSATKERRIDTLEESLSRDMASGQIIDSRTKDSNDQSVEVEDDPTESESQNVAMDIDNNNDKTDFDVKGDDDDDQSEDERLLKSPFICNEHSSQVAQGPIKYVTYFMPWRNSRRQSARFSRCEYSQCAWVTNLTEADAVIVNAGQLRFAAIPEFQRKQSQRWILFTRDPMIKFDMSWFERRDVKSSINLTMWFQLDNDIPLLFGRLQRRKPPAKDYEKLYDSKTKDVAWFVSHCDTWGQREVYVERMRKIVNVDIFGHCGNLKCGIAESKMAAEKTECFQMLTKRYKFYLSFENAFCKDYISEKFFKLFTEVDIIPVVRGGLEYQKYLPSGMFVDAADFKSPEALAKYLVRLGKNKGEYVKMLRTKNSWTSCHFNENEACSVCRYLHTAGNKIHFYENIVEILHGNCWPASDL